MFDIGLTALRLRLDRPGTLEREGEDQEYSSIRPLLDWLNYNGCTVVTKATKEFIDATGCRKLKGNMDIELAVHAMSWRSISTIQCCSPGMVIFAHWRKRFNAALSGSQWSRRLQANLRWFQMSCSPFISRDPTERRASRDLRHLLARSCAAS